MDAQEFLGYLVAATSPSHPLLAPKQQFAARASLGGSLSFFVNKLLESEGKGE